MWVLEHEVKTTASREAVWALWSDVKRWPDWDKSLATVTLDGDFESETFGRLKPAQAREVGFQLLDVDAPASFVDVQLLPAARMITSHSIEPGDGGLVVKQRVTFDGALGRVFSRVIGRSLKTDMPAAMHALVRLAESS